MSEATSVSVKATVTNGALKLWNEDDYKRKLRQMKLGQGEIVVIRVEREAEAYDSATLRYYWGQVVTPFAEYTGYHKQEVHLLLKAECMPEGKTSVTQCNRQEFHDYVVAAEATAREWCPDAFELHEPRRIA